MATIKPLVWTSTKINADTVMAVIPFGILSIKKLSTEETSPGVTHRLELNTGSGEPQEKILEGSLFDCQVRGREFYDEIMKLFMEEEPKSKTKSEAGISLPDYEVIVRSEAGAHITESAVKKLAETCFHAGYYEMDVRELCESLIALK